MSDTVVDTPGATANVGGAKSPRWWRRWIAVTALLVLSPICAEYLIGYDEGIGHPDQLLFGLVILSPLYGTVAVLIREIARRTGRGWPTILLLSVAFGVVQAGLIDQSLFHLEFDPTDPAWATERPNTIIPFLRVDALNLLNFVGGHVIWSFAAPIAVVESCAPKLAKERWLGWPGIVTMALLYLAGAAVVNSDVTTTLTTAQLVGTVVVVVALVVAGFMIRRPAALSSGWVPSWWMLGGGAVVMLAVTQLVPRGWSWAGVAVVILALAAVGVPVLRWSRRPGWTYKHVLALVGAALLVRGVLAFLVEPLGNVFHPAKYAMNTVILVGVIGLLALAWHRSRQQRQPA